MALQCLDTRQPRVSNAAKVPPKQSCMIPRLWRDRIGGKDSMSAAIPSTFAAALAPLLDPAARTTLPHLVEKLATPARLVHELMRRGSLTPFQAKRLIDGDPAELLFANYVLLNQIGEG